MQRTILKYADVDDLLISKRKEESDDLETEMDALSHTPSGDKAMDTLINNPASRLLN